MRELDHRAREALSGRARSVVVTGPAGIGKSALLRAFLKGDACRGATVLRGLCLPDAAGTSFSGLRALLGPTARRAFLDDATHTAVRALAPGALDGLPPHAPAVQQAFHALHRHAADVLARRPLVLALDDAQHCDELSLRWLEFLLRRSADRPLLLVLARQSEATALTRGVPTHHALADLTADCRTTTLRLSTLTERDVAEVVREFFPVPAAPVFVTRARAATGGNPRLLGRLLRELRAAGPGRGWAAPTGSPRPPVASWRVGRANSWTASRPGSVRSHGRWPSSASGAPTTSVRSPASPPTPSRTPGRCCARPGWCHRTAASRRGRRARRCSRPWTPTCCPACTRGRPCS
ncbi:ATP-binding protein [Streptomyces noursei]|uniref:ATP-binding protein n=1 Tax=Streptomyces noursei TaxID=1971 RepID=UPI001F43CB4D|nr:ATP-binding protein [Streptomyces noursei]